MRQHGTGDRDGAERGLQRGGLLARDAVSAVLRRVAAPGTVLPAQDRQGVQFRHGRHQDADTTLLQEQILGVLVHARLFGRRRNGHGLLQAHNEDKERECRAEIIAAPDLRTRGGETGVDRSPLGQSALLATPRQRSVLCYR